MPPTLQQNVLPLRVTDGSTSSTLRILNLTGRYINLPALILQPDGPEHVFRFFRSAEKTIAGIEFSVQSFLLTPLPESSPNVIIVVTEEVAKHYSNRPDIFFPVPDKTSAYPSGAAYSYLGLSRFISHSDPGTRSHPDGF